ncbi:hypothetical protein J6590_018491 [Homalodisca vitripennis]|nr:hypothetical protein J6590_018491 [Homalodisca vitripennis]
MSLRDSPSTVSDVSIAGKCLVDPDDRNDCVRSQLPSQRARTALAARLRHELSCQDSPRVVKYQALPVVLQTEPYIFLDFEQRERLVT